MIHGKAPCRYDNQECSKITSFPYLWVSHLRILNFSSLVIGRGGEQINKLQSETGAKIQVAPGNDVCG